jgi:O-antigen/teichoic acid export membrane protein
MLYGTIIGQTISTLFLGGSFIKDEKKLLRKIRLSKIKEMAVRYRDFPKTTTLSSFVNSFFNNGRYLILGFVLDAGILGQLLLSFRVLSIPVMVIGEAFGDILFQRMSVWNNFDTNMEETFNKLKKVLLVLIAIAVLPVLILFFFGEYIISFVFGSQWTVAGKCSSYLSISLFFQFVASPFCRVFFVIEKQTLYLLWEVLRAIIVFVPILILGYLHYNYTIIVIGMSISISLSYILLLYFLGMVFKCSIKK